MIPDSTPEPEQSSTEASTPQSPSAPVTATPSTSKLPLLTVVLVLTGIVIGTAIAWIIFGKQEPEVIPIAQKSTTSPSAVSTASPTTTASTTPPQWSYTGSSWFTSGNAPACANPLSLATPTTLRAATSILYPGQSRGGNYKPHGGFRFDNAKNNTIPVTLALDAYLYRGARYIESGETQVLLDFINPCGIFLRYDHLLTLDPQFQALVDATLPEAKENASQTHLFSTPTIFTQGTQIASAVGFTNPKNVSFDFGVYDLRSANAISASPSFATKIGQTTELANFGVCWLDLLPSTDATTARSLPGSGTEGKTSDYCK